MVFISLGSTCSIAYNLKLRELRQCSLPFDWVRIKNLNNVSKLLQNKFSDFLDISTFNFKEISNKFMVNGKCGSYIYKNKYCGFYHEFNDYIENICLKEFIDKYKRRIQRLYDILQSEEEITFIREENGKISINKINKFIETIKKINSNIKFKIIIINNYRNNHIIIDNVNFYFSNKEVTDWKRPEINWAEIFSIK